MSRVTLASRAQRDLKSIDKPDRQRIVTALRELAADPPPDNLDVRPLAGSPPWRRLRVGTWRVLYRPAEPDVLLIARVVNRRDLERAVRNLV